MPRTKLKSEVAFQPAPHTAANGLAAEVLTLGEAAAYLRLPEVDVLRLVDEQGLPGRQLGGDWRFLKHAVERWLGTPPPKENHEGIWAAAGSWKDDPYLDEMMKDIFRRRGRSVI